MASRIKVSALALVLFGSGVLAVCGDRSAAAPLTAEFTDLSGGWRASARFDSNGKLELCMAVRYGSDPALGLAATPAESGEGIQFVLARTGRDLWPLGKQMSVDRIPYLCRSRGSALNSAWPERIGCFRF
jgi:hypothetical protein